jgi:hypothetical protein
MVIMETVLFVHFTSDRNEILKQYHTRLNSSVEDDP